MAIIYKQKKNYNFIKNLKFPYFFTTLKCKFRKTLSYCKSRSLLLGSKGNILPKIEFIRFVIYKM